ncbi:MULTISPECIES: hypothetical protein [unclassified Phyllobacterium]|uniref:hypothetical protein n=1 Tax=Phyllobacterium TaxID=28100 RepID=UPI0015FA4B38|nr:MULTISPECIES: hypothetical protein [unclassified Phyllobacterium]MBA8901698.1 drug/metabolite transporter (DMT)-like permease [Phyllobacterium sp. P30BS-XVII]UGX88956.1 hypothetical protein LLE53_020995 [Phyllobacterium sp. T1293]
MPRISQLYFKTATILFLVGIVMGLHMGISGNHNTYPAHAHLNLLGWVSSAIFGIYFALNPAKAGGRLPMIQFVVYTIGVIVMTVGLYLMLQGNPAMDALVGIGSFIVLAGVLLFTAIVFSRDA